MGEGRIQDRQKTLQFFSEDKVEEGSTEMDSVLTTSIKLTNSRKAKKELPRGTVGREAAESRKVERRKGIRKLNGSNSFTSILQHDSSKAAAEKNNLGE